MKVFLTLLLAAGLAHAESMSLGEVLSQHKKTFSERMPKEVLELYEKNIKDMKAAGLDKQSIKVGEKIPDVEITLNGKKIPLSRIYGVGPLVLKFYRGSWCVYCMTELKHYEQKFSAFTEAGAQIIGISPDTPAVLGKAETKNLSFDVVSDENHAIARKFGLVYKLDSKVVDHLKSSGVDLSVYQGNTNNELTIPATFVISRSGRVSFAFVDADYRKRAEPEQVLQVIKALPK